MQTLSRIFDAEALAPQGACLLWRPELLWLHAVADALIGLSLWSIPGVVLVVARRRLDLSLRGALVPLALFLLAGGLSHFAGVWTLWRPDHGVAGAIKAAAAAASVAGAIAAWSLLPRTLAALASPGPAPLAGADGAPSGEVVARPGAVAHSRPSEARFADLFEHAADGLFVIRAGGGGGRAFETVNPSFAALLRLPRERIEGASIAEALGRPAAAAELEAAVSACLASGRTQAWESGGDGADARRHWHTVLVPLPPGGAGGPRRLLGSLRDVTELRRLQERLAEASRRAMVGTLCAGVAHEMSQPVNIIGLWAERGRATLDASAAGTRPARSLEVVWTQTRRLGAMLERMRELTREDPGEARPFDAAAAVRDAVEAARRAWAADGTERPPCGADGTERPPCGADGIEIRVETVRETAPATVHGRAALLEQAVLQLLDNARDAVAERRRTEPGAPARIRVSVVADPVAGRLRIRLRDTGGGVPEALGDRILDPFVTTKDPGGGGGLGLPIAAGIARALGGTLAWCNRDQGLPEAGAEFRLCLPLWAAAAAEEDRAA